MWLFGNREDNSGDERARMAAALERIADALEAIAASPAPSPPQPGEGSSAAAWPVPVVLREQPASVAVTNAKAWGLTGAHLRYKLNAVSGARVKADLDALHAAGLRGYIVLATQSWDRGNWTSKTTRLPSGVVVPDYWSDEVVPEYLARWSAVRGACGGHPALAGVLHSFGADDESWYSKNGQDNTNSERVGGYCSNYARALYRLSGMWHDVPVYAQAAPLAGLSRWWLRNLLVNSPMNVGLKLNNLDAAWASRTTAWAHDPDVNKFGYLDAWRWAQSEKRALALEPKTVGGDLAGLMEIAKEAGAGWVCVQREYFEKN